MSSHSMEYVGRHRKPDPPTVLQKTFELFTHPPLMAPTNNDDQKDTHE